MIQLWYSPENITDKCPIWQSPVSDCMANESNGTSAYQTLIIKLVHLSIKWKVICANICNHTHKVWPRVIAIVLELYNCRLAKLNIEFFYCSIAKEDPLWNVCPSPSLTLISFWGLKLIWKSAYLEQALQIGNFIFWLDVVRLFYTHYKPQLHSGLHWYKVLSQLFALFILCFVVHNNIIDAWNVGPPLVWV